MSIDSLPDDTRWTVNLSVGLIKKLDCIRYGSESWEQFLKKALPILIKWRENEMSDRLKTLSE